MKVPPRQPIIAIHDWQEYHETCVLVGPSAEQHELVASSDTLIRAIEVDVHLKQARPNTTKLYLALNDRHLGDWDAASLSSQAYATAYARLKEDCLAMLDAFLGLDTSLDPSSVLKRIRALGDRVLPWGGPDPLHFAVTVLRDQRLVLGAIGLDYPDIMRVTLHRFRRVL